MDALLHDTANVINTSLLPSEGVDDDGIVEDDGQRRDGSSNGDCTDDVPDPLPDDKGWVTAGKLKGFEGTGTGRALGSGLDARQSLPEVSAVISCSDALSVVLRDGPFPGMRKDAVDRFNELHSTLALCSDKKMNGRVFCTKSNGHDGLVAKFGRNGPRSRYGLHQAASIELSLVQDDEEDIMCACSCAEQCLRVKRLFTD